MGDNKNSLIPDNAITDLTKNTYGDIAHPILQEVGNMGAAIMKFVALPFRFLGLTAEELEVKYANFLKKTLNKVPQDECIIPKGVVASPLLDHVKFVFDEEGLSEMFSNLLANAMSANVEKMVHPAFVEMLKQMSPLDVEFMHIYFNKDDIVEASEIISWKRGEAQLSLTVDSLSRLGIVESISYDDRDDVALELTNFGKVFRNICMMSPAEIDMEDFFDEDDRKPDEKYTEPSDIGFMFGDSFGTARKSSKNERIYVRQHFSMQDVRNGSSIVIVLRVSNTSDETQIIDSLYIECENKKHIIAENPLPSLLPVGKYIDFVFGATSENGLLEEAVKEHTNYVLETHGRIFDMPITNATKREVGIFLTNYRKGENLDE